MDIIHSQLSHILVLLVEFVRLAGLGPPQSEKLDTEKNRTHRRLFLFTHAERISRWVHTFDPSDRSLENIGLLEE